MNRKNYTKTVYYVNGQREKLWRNKEGYCYYFRFIDGGINHVWAKNLIEAKKKAQMECGSLKVDLNSLHKVTLSEANEIDRELYLRTC